MSRENDVIVIGGGPGGYVAAIRAAQLGLTVSLVEREHLGGICLNWGCIPTKALLRSAEIYRTICEAEHFGFNVGKPDIDFDKIVARSREVSGKLSSGIGSLMTKNNVNVIMGEATLTGKGEITVTDADGNKEKHRAKNIIIATGARARLMPGHEDDDSIWYYKQALQPDTLPNDLLVIGSGAIGVEFASFFATLGSNVTIVEALDRIVPLEDKDVSAAFHASLDAQGIDVITSGLVEKLTTENGKTTAQIKLSDDSTQELVADRVICAIGITGNVEGLGLEGMGVKVDRGHVVTNEWCETSASNIYAIGDVAGAPWLAHKASHEGVMVAEKIAGLNDVHPMDKTNIPSCVYAHPQIASLGLTEDKAKDEGYDVKVGRFPFGANGKALALGEENGFIKTVVDAKTGELLGAHMIGAEVTELIQGFTIARTFEMTTDDLKEVVFPHPTLSEMMHESILATANEALHI